MRILEHSSREKYGQSAIFTIANVMQMEESAFFTELIRNCFYLPFCQVFTITAMMGDIWSPNYFPFLDTMFLGAKGLSFLWQRVLLMGSKICMSTWLLGGASWEIKEQRVVGVSGCGTRIWRGKEGREWGGATVQERQNLGLSAWNARQISQDNF